MGGGIAEAELSGAIIPPREQLPAADGEGVASSSRDMRPCGVPAENRLGGGLIGGVSEAELSGRI